MSGEEEDGMGFAGPCSTDSSEDRCWEELGERNQQLLDAKAEIAKLTAALQKAEEADQFHINCEECNGEETPEACARCFPLADDARLMRWAALGLYESPEDEYPIGEDGDQSGSHSGSRHK